MRKKKQNKKSCFIDIEGNICFAAHNIGDRNYNTAISTIEFIKIKVHALAGHCIRQQFGASRPWAGGEGDALQFQTSTRKGKKWTDVTLKRSHVAVGATRATRLEFLTKLPPICFLCPRCRNPFLKATLCGGRWLVGVRGQRSDWAAGLIGDCGKSNGSSHGFTVGVQSVPGVPNKVAGGRICQSDTFHPAGGRFLRLHFRPDQAQKTKLEEFHFKHLLLLCRCSCVSMTRRIA